eukprot:TRINITY_DN19564_c0_g1_i1.p1 TRINITY_DN19564_c0_g1~~TRINITY_DN19564_c0_g1_i1.p1  ORF type:complete len:224 (-),score=14.05 TRINITY_DN19564_c0_g1_i1:149-820(-)
MGEDVTFVPNPAGIVDMSQSIISFSGPRQSKIDTYQLSNYTFGMKDAQQDKDNSPPARLLRMKEKYQVEGMRRSVDGVLLVHLHKHPHVLLLQIGNSCFKLPGGRCKAGEDEVSCLKRKLNKKLAPSTNYQQPNWEVGELLATFWRPNFDQHMYPYVPPHITKPKECRRLYIVPLPEKCIFSVPRNYKLLAVPLFELQENTKRYGSVIASIPQALSRFNVNYI